MVTRWALAAAFCGCAETSRSPGNGATQDGAPGKDAPTPDDGAGGARDAAGADGPTAPSIPLLEGALAFCLGPDACGYGRLVGLTLSGCVAAAVAAWAPGLGAATADSPIVGHVWLTWGACLIKASSCDDVAACLGGGAPPEPCVGYLLPRGDYCVGSVAYECAWAGYLQETGSYTTPYRVARDCALKSTGLECLVNEMTGIGDCSAGSCSAKSWACEGSTHVRCEPPWLHVYDCAYFDLECTPIRCDGPYGECTKEPPTEPYCVGDVAYVCVGTGFAAYDCGARLDATVCGKDGWCAEAGGECSSESYESECSGTSISYCLDGFIRNYDCTSLFFAGCDAGPPARCVP